MKTRPLNPFAKPEPPFKSGDAFTTPKARRIRQREQEAWIRRYKGFFGDPPELGAFRAGEIDFRRLYESAIKTAEGMVTEAQHCPPSAFV